MRKLNFKNYPKQLLELKQFLLLFWVGLLCLHACCTPLVQSIQAATTSTTENDTAKTDFWVDLNTTYTVPDNGPTQVDHQFTVTNKTPSYFISKYSLKLSSNRITNVVVKVGQQTIGADVSTTASQTNVSFAFPDQVVGEGKQLHFSVSYQNPDLAQISGQVLELSVPPLASPDTYRNYEVTLKTPARFGQPTRSSPEATQTTTQGNQVIASFDKAASQGIASVYGSEQLFQLNLEYPLDNSSNQPILTQITLPPDTATQRLYYQNLNPLPTSWKVDADGNWLASYYLKANQKITVTTQIVARLRLTPDPSVPVIPPSAQTTAAQEFWPTTDPTIVKLAVAHPTPADIYDFTLQSLNYTTADLSQDLKRLGATAALQASSSATCQEYADVFITLARANKIPARRLVGYAQTQNQKLRPVSLAGDILHAWPEYYDETANQWVQVDPTWGDTTGGVDYLHQMDLNHLVFAINGESSLLPYPVGSYKPGEKPTKTITVGFASEFPTSQPDLQLSLQPKKLGPVTLPGWYDLTLNNPTGSAWYGVQLDLPEGLHLHADQPVPAQLLPYQTFTTTVSVYNTVALDWPEQRIFDVTLKITSQPAAVATTTAALYVFPASLRFLTLPIAGLAVGLGLGLGAVGAGRLLVLGRRRAHSVRG